MSTDYDPNYIPHKTFFLIGQKAVIFNARGQMLLLLRSQKAGYAGKWSLTGGALEENEEPKEGIEREIAEETQLTVRGLKPFTSFLYKNNDGDSLVIIGYTCTCDDPHVVINWEHDAYKWVSKDEALALNLGEHARKLIEQLA
ncbi:hypothetical protein C5B42_03725 [Candidatus Cerribacteria bacterium 'Amazon FNV 2010 28 9']|uniref:Nudix hydrolase domain-containing protein n=1 Tax=Candidatus Cerribacteria bacterium 'Amazon FNV 2010 28 9' TaxID=2081795 RepID=A0A317JNV7_9BACT|nr:MAG: hypothetical protein C5B42_03725 [Candidatus Cerribacteria bacterium 'Amazon FNV 2010 28 9']